MILHTPIVRIARKLRCDEGCVRHYAREARSPEQRMRRRLRETFGWAEDVWNRPPGVELTLEPATTRVPEISEIPDTPKERIRTERPTS
jgi:hypothetical protein